MSYRSASAAFVHPGASMVYPICDSKSCSSGSPRQESNLYLALRRRPFYPLNYRELLRICPQIYCAGIMLRRAPELDAGPHPSRKSAMEPAPLASIPARNPYVLLIHSGSCAPFSLPDARSLQFVNRF